MKTVFSDAAKTSASTKPSHSDIAALAYSLYVEHGCQPGHELDDWLRAEQLVSKQNGNGNGHQNAPKPGIAGQQTRKRAR